MLGCIAVPRSQSVLSLIDAVIAMGAGLLIRAGTVTLIGTMASSPWMPSGRGGQCLASAADFPTMGTCLSTVRSGAMSGSFPRALGRQRHWDI